MQRVPKLRLRGRPRTTNFSAGSIKSAAGFVSPNNFTMLGFVMYLGTAADYALAISEVNGVSYSGLAAVFGSDIGIWGGNGGTFAQILTYTNNIWYGEAFTASTVSTTQTTKGFVKTRSGLFSTASQTATAAGGTTDVLYIGNDNDGSGNPNALLSGWRIYDYPLSPKEINEELQQRAPRTTRGLKAYLPFSDRGSVLVDEYQHATPWTTQAGTFTTSLQIPPVPEVVRRKSFVYFGSSGGPAAYTLTAAQGSFTLTGEAAALRAARILTAAQASFAMTGEASTLAVSMPAAAGSFALTGQAANLRAARILPAAQGSLALAGEAVALETAMPATSGSFALTGEAAALRAARVLAAAEASFNLTGEASAFGATMPAAAGVFVFTGESATLRAARAITAAEGAFALTGEASNLGATMPAAQASFVLTGNDATLSHGTPGALAADPGFFTITGEPAALRAARRLTAAQGSLALTGEAATLAAAMPASSSSFVLTGEPAALRAARILTASSATIAITGEAATLRVSGAVVDLEPSVVLSSSLLVACASSSMPILSVTLT